MQHNQELSLVPRVVLIAEQIDVDPKDVRSPFAVTREMADAEHVRDVIGAFEERGVAVVHYCSPDALMENAHRHKDDIVFSLWAGALLPSRLLLVSSICDAYGLKYFGPDAISRAFCVEKSLAKHLARRHGFATANEVVAYRYQGHPETISLRPPVIVKPASEGSSLGIHSNSVCESLDAVITNMSVLWDNGFDPVLIEEFIVGKEAIAYIAGNKHRVFCKTYENFVQGDEGLLERQPFGADILVTEMGRRGLSRPVTDHLERSAVSMFEAFSKMQLFAINGRVDQFGNFVFVEMNGFPSLMRGSATYHMFAESGRSYGQFLVTLLDLALEDYQAQGFGELERSDDIFRPL